MLREPLLLIQFLIYILAFSTLGYPISTNDEIGRGGGASNTGIILESNIFKDFIVSNFHDAVTMMRIAAEICVERVG